MTTGGVRQGPLFHQGASYRSGVPEEGPIPHVILLPGHAGGALEAFFFLLADGGSMAGVQDYGAKQGSAVLSHYLAGCPSATLLMAV